MQLRNFSHDELPRAFAMMREYYGNGDLGATVAGAFLGLVERIGELERRIAELEQQKRK